jgi:hypothetical protein
MMEKNYSVSWYHFFMCVGSVLMIKLNYQNLKALESRYHAKEN